MTTIVTPTIGHPRLKEALQSVRRQTQGSCRHLVVVDGRRHLPKVERILAQVPFKGDVVVLPDSTGDSGYNGHLVYLISPFISKAEFIAFLDEDNTYDSDHIESLQRLCARNSLDWAYSLRRVFSDGYSAEDNCQSLGWWPAYNGPYHLIDTSCYFIRRTVIQEGASVWNRMRWTPQKRAPDGIFSEWLMHRYPRGYTMGKYTVNYWLGPSGPSTTRKKLFFDAGNAVNGVVYRHFPWLALSPSKNGMGENMQLRCQNSALWKDVSRLDSRFRNLCKAGEFTIPHTRLLRTP